MKAEDFDRFRAEYDSMSPGYISDFYCFMAEEHPEQPYFSPQATMRFFRDGLAPVQMKVLEIGGWDGAAAKMVLNALGPESVESWTNYEMARSVVYPATSDARYHVPDFDGQPWEDDLSRYNVLHCSHVLEHLKLEQIRRLLSACRNVVLLYVEAPLSEEPMDWAGSTSTHVIEAGWAGLDELIRVFGFMEFMRCDGEVEKFPNTVRGYAR